MDKIAETPTSEENTTSRTRRFFRRLLRKRNERGTIGNTQPTPSTVHDINAILLRLRDAGRE